MNTFKKLSLAAALVPALLAGQAMAATFSAGSVGASPYVNNVTAHGSFADVYNFSIGGGGLSAGGLSLELPFGAMALFHISDLTFSLFSDAISVADASAALPIATFSGVSGSWEGSVPAGNYRFEVTGVASGLAGGNYTFSIAAVPEPGEWLMLTAGLGLLAGAARRRKA